jgi:hypothetical protein
VESCVHEEINFISIKVQSSLQADGLVLMLLYIAAFLSLRNSVFICCIFPGIVLKVLS